MGWRRKDHSVRCESRTRSREGQSVRKAHLDISSAPGSFHKGKITKFNPRAMVNDNPIIVFAQNGTPSEPR